MNLNKPLRVVLGEPHAVSGSVFDEAHHPLAGASVTFSSSRGNSATRGAGFLYFSDGAIKARMTTTTGADGSWKLGNIPADSQVSVTVTAAGRATATAQIATDGAAQTVLHPGAQMSGRLLGLTGQPLGGVTVYVGQQTRDLGMRAGGEGTTDKEGRWTVSGLPQGIYQVRFFTGDAAAFVVPITRDITATPGAPLQLPDARAVAGTLIGGKVVAADDAKTPVAGVSVMLQSDDDAEHYESATTDAKGHWQLRTLEKAGHLYVGGTPREFSNPMQRRAVSVEQSQMNLDFSLPRNIQITGRLVDEKGQGVTGAGLVLRQSGRYEEFPIESDKAGQFTAFVPKAGEMEVGVPSWSAETPETQWDVVGGPKITVAPGQPLMVKLRPAQISTLLVGVFDETDAAVEGAKVVVLLKTPSLTPDEDGNGDGESYEQREVVSDKTGRIRVEGIRANQKVAFQSATKEGFDTAPLPSVEKRNGLYHADITLKRRGGKADGRVLNAAGAPVAGAAVFGSGIETTSDAAGHFSLAPLPTGKTDIFAWHGDGFALAQSDAARLDLKPQALEPTDATRAQQILTALYKATEGTGYWNRDSLKNSQPSADFNAIAATARADGDAGIPRVISRFASDSTIPTARWIALLQSAPKPSERLLNVSFWVAKVAALSDSDAARALLATLQDDVTSVEKNKDPDQKWQTATGIFGAAGLAERLGDQKTADLLFGRGEAFVTNNFPEKAANPRDDQSQNAVFASAASTVAVSPRLLGKLEAMVETDSPSYTELLRQGAPALARIGGLDAAKPFLDKLKGAPTPKADANGYVDSTKWNYLRAVSDSITAGGPSNPKLALELASSLPRNSNMGDQNGRDQAICEAAFFQTPAVARGLWGDSLPKLEAGAAMRFVARIFATDEPLARSFYEKVRAKLDAQPNKDPNAPVYAFTNSNAAFAFYEARFAPARARYRLEKEFQRAQKGQNARYELGTYIRAMAAFDANRALQWADQIGNTDNNFAGFEAKRQIGRYLTMDETARRKINLGTRFGGDEEF